MLARTRGAMPAARATIALTAAIAVGGALARLAALALSAALPGIAAAALSAPAGAALAGYTGSDRLERIIAAAKKEGRLTFYTTFAERDLPALLKPFQAEYGIKVDVWRAGTDKVLQRMVAEGNAHRYNVDVIHFGSPEMEALHREKLLMPVVTPAYEGLREGSVPAHHEWATTLLSVFVQAYNTNAVKKDELPRSFAELLDPRWKGKLGIEGKSHEWFATTVQQLGGDQGMKLFREIAARNGMSVRQGHALLNNLVISGEVPLALSMYNYMPTQAKRNGAPVDWFVIEPAVARGNAVGVALHAPHPAAALLFEEFMLTEAQPIIAEMDYVPAATKVPSALKRLRMVVVDPAQALDRNEAWARQFDEAFLKR
jgi:iron(III) transport system substrate-binding protein